MDALVIHTNLAAALMELQFNKDHMVMVVTVRKRNTNAAQMVSRRPLEKTLPDAHVPQANMAVVRMALLMPKAHTSMVAMIFHQHRKRHAALPRMAAHAAITQLNTSLIWNMGVAHASGTAAVEAMKIVSKPLMNVRALVNNQLAKMPAKYQRFMDHVLATIKNTIMIQIATFAHRSFMAVAWAIPIVSKHWTNVNHNVSSMNHCVSKKN